MKTLKKLLMITLVAFSLTGCSKPNAQASLDYGRIESSKLVVECIVNGDDNLHVWLVPVSFTGLDGSDLNARSDTFYCSDFTCNGKGARGIATRYSEVAGSELYNVTDYYGYSGGETISSTQLYVVYMFDFEVKDTDKFKFNKSKVTSTYNKVCLDL